MSGTVLITGANRGIGLAFTQQYLSKGYNVFACCRAPESASELLSVKQAFPDHLNIMPLDVTDSAQMQILQQTLSGEPIDILINNAGVYGPKTTSFGQVTEEDWVATLKTNTIAPLLVTQLLVDNVAVSQQKKIILMTSKMGSMTDNSSGGSYIYRSSKAALNAIGKSLSYDLSPKGIKVALLHPGWVKTDMGGSNALVSTEDSAKGLCQVIDNLKESSSGCFYDYKGKTILW